MLAVLLCFTCDKDDDDQEVCNMTNSDFAIASGWLQLQSTTSNGLTNIAFLNDDFGIVSGSIGTFLKTNSGGLCWETLDVGVAASFFTAFIIDENNFFTSRSSLYKTNDGGQTFNEIGELGNFGGGIFDIHFFNENKGILIKGGSDLYKTEDGGQTWVNIYTNYGSAQHIQFVTEEVGYLNGGSQFDNVNYGEIHKSVDGGNTWVKIESEPNISRALVRTLYFVNENLGYFMNSLREFYVTQDGGLTWTLRSTISDTILDMVFVNAPLGYAVGGQTIYKTEDAGVTWTVDYVSENVEDDLYSITKTPNGSIFVVGKNGTLLKKE